jgi:hypothetical protein
MFPISRRAARLAQPSRTSPSMLCAPTDSPARTFIGRTLAAAGLPAPPVGRPAGPPGRRTPYAGAAVRLRPHQRSLVPCTDCGSTSNLCTEVVIMARVGRGRQQGPGLRATVGRGNAGPGAAATLVRQRRRVGSARWASRGRREELRGPAGDARIAGSGTTASRACSELDEPRGPPAHPGHFQDREEDPARNRPDPPLDHRTGRRRRRAPDRTVIPHPASRTPHLAPLPTSTSCAATKITVLGETVEPTPLFHRYSRSLS